MFGLFQRPKLSASFSPAEAWSEEFTRAIAVAGILRVTNAGSDTTCSETELLIIAGFRRIPIEVPDAWRTFAVAGNGDVEQEVRWALTLEAPLRAERGELYLSLRDHKRRKWEWRLPFTFEIR